MQNKNAKIIVACFVLILTIVFMNNKTHHKELTIALVMPPTSTDPLDYDYSIHHNTMRSVFASLVSQYKVGEITPQIAEEWNVSEDKKIWKFKIDRNWTFENGDKVTSEIVLKNFKRVLILKNKDNSKSGLLEYLVDSNKLKSFDENIEGMKVQGDWLVLSFVKPVEDVLEKISFGIYAIAHPNDYDVNGLWRNKNKAIASGLYRISTWDREKFILELRSNLHTKISTAKNIQRAIFIFPDDMGQVGNASLIFSDRLSNALDEKEWSFASTSLDNKIIYVQVMNWSDKASMFSDKEFRQNLRDLFYSNLESSGMKPKTSFFPLSIKGIREFKYNVNASIKSKVDVLKTQPFFTTKYKAENKKKTQGDIFAEAFYGLCKSIKADPVINNYPEKSADEKKVFDIQFLGTGVSIDSPREDIRFMFLSKQGIMLPDESGKILSVLDSNFDIQKINEELWDQAIVWPIKHYSSGFWYKNKSEIDFSNLNLALTPIDLQFIFWK